MTEQHRTEEDNTFPSAHFPKKCADGKDFPRLGLALSGGGALGAYQIGVWKALQESGLSQHIQIIAGTSIGAVNGAMIVQGAFEQLEDMWRNMKPGNIFQSLQSFSSLHEMNTRHYMLLAKDLLTKGRIDITPFKQNLKATIDEARIRKANIQFALNVWDVFKFRGEQYLLSDIPEGQLVDYILASASFPLFWAHEIEGRYYLDGGIDLNLPIDIPFEKSSADHVIAVDVATYMKYRPKQVWKVNQNKDRLTLIRPSKNIGSPMSFSAKIANRQIELGYQDAVQKLTPFAEKFNYPQFE
jgi:NTE family protein